MAKKKDSGPNTGPWKIGAYYKNLSEITITEAWGQPMPGNLRIKPDAIWLCHQMISKFVPETAYENPGFRRFIRLVTYDPRFTNELKRYVHYDERFWSFEDYTGGFEEIDSPLIVLALTADDIAPVTG